MAFWSLFSFLIVFIFLKKNFLAVFMNSKRCKTRRYAKAYKDVVALPERVLENGLRASEWKKKAQPQPHKQQ